MDGHKYLERKKTFYETSPKRKKKKRKKKEKKDCLCKYLISQVKTNDKFLPHFIKKTSLTNSLDKCDWSLVYGQDKYLVDCCEIEGLFGIIIKI